ncbi:MAG: NAD(P)/FAD-dependent oxidoreductase [Gemmatimonadales bacterium]|nr:MAG: NAD(P)/FAD-dependent oxidoreductase [Gemmatimonadales bacterium]
MAPSGQPRVLVLGGGFGGLNAVRALKGAPVDVLLIDRENYHLFQPLLYQVATAALNPSDIAYPLRSALRKQENASVLLAEVRDVDVDAAIVYLDNGELRYDYLVVATGATHSYFGNDLWARDAPGLKTIGDALEMRRRIYLAYEAAERESDPELRKVWLTFVVIGAGPTGVELAGALAEIGRQSLDEGYRNIDRDDVRVLLVEGQERVLPAYGAKGSASALKQLERLGVEVRLQAFVTDIDFEGVSIGDERLEARTVLWAAGVAASPLAQSLGAPLDYAGCVVVEPDLSVPGHGTVFVVGDLASIPFHDGRVPGVAPAAIQQGRHTARNIRRLLTGQQTLPFSYVDKGSLATIGRAAAVAELGRLRFGGFLAWMAWLLIHIFNLIGFRNRVWVLAGWAWSYVTFKRGARLITGKHPFGNLPEVRGTAD